jgi:hypothetical protein
VEKQRGIVADARMSQSGKTLGLKIGERWMQTKNFALQNAIGREIEYDVGTSEWNGKVMYWANDAELESDSVPRGTSQPPTGVGSATSSSVAPTNPAARDRDASIIAQALTKACTAPGDDVEVVWTRYCSFYEKALKGDTSTKVAPEAKADFDDDIPF